MRPIPLLLLATGLVACGRTGSPRASSVAPSPSAVGPIRPQTGSDDQIKKGSDDANTKKKELRDGEALRDAREFPSSAQSSDSPTSPSSPVERLESIPFDVESYHLRGAFEWKTQTLTATVDIAIAAIAVGADAARTLSLDAAMERIDRVELFAPGALAPTALLPFVHDLKTARLDVTLPASAGPGGFTLRVAYFARESSALRAIEARAGDPISVPVVYTTSEPLGAANWMPCHNTPSDRARFSVTLASSLGERVVANGALTTERVDDKGTRTTTWETSYTLPTYLMAFAVGAFQVNEERFGGVPLSIWAREGVRVDAAGLLAMLRAQMTRFENLLVPYPFEKYAVVLLPDFPAGGIEHAGVTFQRETRSTEASLSGDFGLYAHELAHQWFGDFVTVETWDDLWIKEGMATLLGAEATRGFDDRSARFHLFGHSFGFLSGEAIRDPQLPPDEKYTSGPYDRSAWFFTQVRHRLGEGAFWRAMRDLLNANAFGTLNAQKVIARFAQDLGPEFEAQATRALAAKEVPVLKVETDEAGAQALTLVDTEGSLLAPLTLRVVSQDGTAARQVDLVAQARFPLAGFTGADAGTDANAWLQIDPDVVHPALDLDWLGATKLADVPALRDALSPKSDAQRSTFLSLAAPQQAFHYRSELGGETTPDSLRAVFPSLGSDSAQTAALIRACALAAQAEANADPAAAANAVLWNEAVRDFAQIRSFRGYERRGAGYVACAKALAPLYSGSAQRLLATPGRALLSDAALMELSVSTFEPGVTANLWRSLVLSGPTLRSREIAVSTLARFVTNPALFSIAPDTPASWAVFLRDVFLRTPASELTGPTLDLADGVAKKGLGEAMPAFVEALSVMFDSPQPRSAQGRALCLAWTVSGGEGNAPWDAFKLKVQDSVNLVPSVRVVLEDPKACAQ